MNQTSILIVEDEAIIAADLVLKLRRLGYHVSGTTDTGEQAVDLIRQQAPDLVLMDIRLAGALDGIETARAIRSVCDVPVVYLTAHSDEATLERAGQTEPFGFIAKPFNERDLHIHIKMALYKHAAEQRLRECKERLKQLNVTLEQQMLQRGTELERTNRSLLVILDSSPNALVMADAAGRIVMVNSMAERVFGYTREEMVGQKVEMLVPERLRGSHPGHRAGFFTAPQARPMGAGRDLFGRRKDGSEFPIEIGLNPLVTEEATRVLSAIVDITERKRLEAEVLRISEDERKRIGDDLHDDLGQQLTGIRLFSTTLANQLRARSAPEAAGVAAITDLLDNALNLTRSLARGLHPVAASPEGLMIALDDLTSRTSGLFGRPCSFVCRNPVHIHQPAVATHLFRIAQEAVTNAVKHAHASQIEIKLSSDNRSTELSIRDDGTGIPIFDPVVESTGMGMRIMNYRADMIGGTLQIQRNASGAGTTVTCTILAAAAQP